jgi:serine/threonine-protein kinase
MLYPLSKGGMGVVWVGEHVELEAKVAVKFIDARLASDEHAKKRFRREAQAAAALKGPHVVSVFDYGIDSGQPYIVMELLEGEPLAARLEREVQLTVEETRQVVEQAGKALERAHARGIVHRDLKPDNVFLVDDAPGFSVKLLDFGVAQVSHGFGETSELLTQPGDWLGTLHYMSPEQVHGRDVDARTDVWSLAVLVFECLTGQLPVDASSGPRLVASICHEALPRASTFAEVPQGFDAWFERATRKNPVEREASIESLVEQFQELVRGKAGKCALRDAAQRHSVPNVIAYTTSEGPERRRTSSIPAAINGRRDINHIALISKISERSAVLWTRHRAEPGQAMRLTLHLEDETEGPTTFAEVVEVNDDRGDRPDMWPYEMTVRWVTPLTGIEQKIDRAGLK